MKNEDTKQVEMETPAAAPAETESASPAEETAAEPAPAARKRNKPSFLATYIFALLFIALLLVFLSYLSQMRATKAEFAEKEEQHNLFSVNALNSIDKLTAERDELKETAARVRSERDEAKTSLEETQNELKETSAQLESVQKELTELKEEYAGLINENNDLGGSLKALSIATEITELVRLEDYDGAMELADTFEGSALEELVQSDYPVQYEAYAAALVLLHDNFEE